MKNAEWHRETDFSLAIRHLTLGRGAPGFPVDPASATRLPAFCIQLCQVFRPFGAGRGGDSVPGAGAPGY